LLDFLKGFLDGTTAPKRGYLNADSMPRGATLFINGKVFGQTLRSLVLSVGTYNVTMKSGDQTLLQCPAQPIRIEVNGSHNIVCKKP
jgi:hypothetical protein